MKKRLIISNVVSCVVVALCLTMSLPAAARSNRGGKAGEATSLILPLSASSKKLQDSFEARKTQSEKHEAQSEDADNPLLRWQNGVNTVELSQLIKDQNNGVRHCYESELKRTPKLQGSIDVRFKITHWGRVGKTKVTDESLGNSKVRRCVVKAIRKWRFPYTKKGGVMVELPILFTPQDNQVMNPNLHTAGRSQQIVPSGV